MRYIGMTELVLLPISETFLDFVMSLLTALRIQIGFSNPLPCLSHSNTKTFSFFLGVWKDKEQRPKVLFSHYLFSIFKDPVFP